MGAAGVKPAVFSFSQEVCRAGAGDAFHSERDLDTALGLDQSRGLSYFKAATTAAPPPPPPDHHPSPSARRASASHGASPLSSWAGNSDLGPPGAGLQPPDVMLCVGFEATLDCCRVWGRRCTDERKKNAKRGKVLGWFEGMHYGGEVILFEKDMGYEGSTQIIPFRSIKPPFLPSRDLEQLLTLPAVSGAAADTTDAGDALRWARALAQQVLTPPCLSTLSLKARVE